MLEGGRLPNITSPLLLESITSGVLQETELINTINLQPSAPTNTSVHHITPSPYSRHSQTAAWNSPPIHTLFPHHSARKGYPSRCMSSGEMVDKPNMGQLVCLWRRTICDIVEDWGKSKLVPALGASATSDIPRRPPKTQAKRISFLQILQNISNNPAQHEYLNQTNHVMRNCFVGSHNKPENLRLPNLWARPIPNHGVATDITWYDLTHPTKIYN